MVIVLGLLGAAFLWTRSRGGVEVTTALAQVSGGGAGSSTGITANGYVVDRTQASVSSRITGRLDSLPVDVGTVLEKGDIIARLENSDFKAAVSQERANVERSRAALADAVAVRDQLRRDLARVEELGAKDAASEQEVERIAAELSSAEARVELQQAQIEVDRSALALAQSNLDFTYIRAPFDGTILRKDAELGEVVAPVATGSGLTRGAVVTMADLETLEVEVDVNEAYIAQLENGQPAEIRLDAYPRDAYEGEIRQIVPTADRQRATVEVKVAFVDVDDRVLPEMAARVEFREPASADEAAAPSRITVPSEAVRDEAGQAVVWLVRDDRHERRVVEAGPVSGGRREVLSGISGGERLVVSAAGELEDGARVKEAE
ncbi:MAG: efflux RND transporter periplasmic adaptor subunit [Gemmatimonadota bacterium]